MTVAQPRRAAPGPSGDRDPDRAALSHPLSRRSLLLGGAGAAALLLPGCGRADAPPPGSSVLAPPRVAFWGDSLTEGFPVPPFAKDHSDSLPGVFAARNPTSTIYNGGVGGQSAEEVALRQGGMTLHLSVVGGLIPASGDVAVTTRDVVGWRLDRSWWCDGSLAGVDGTVRRTGEQLVFERYAPGKPERVAGVVAFVSKNATQTRADVQVLFVGRNDIDYPSPAGEPQTRVVRAYESMLEHLPAGQRALVLGTTTGTWEIRGTSGYGAVTAINASLAARYPLSFFDVRRWLVRDAIGAIGASPSEQDRANMAADTLPPSIMVPGDTVHYSPATAAALADEIRDQLAQRGWSTGS